MNLATLAEVRDLVEKQLSAAYRHRATRRHVSTQIAEAAKGNKDPLEKSVCRFVWCWRSKASNA
jgi:hypothetical protein